MALAVSTPHPHDRPPDPTRRSGGPPWPLTRSRARRARVAPRRLRRLLLDNGALSALVVLVVAMSLLSGDFLTTRQPAQRRCPGGRDRDPRVRRDLRHRLGGHRPVGRLGGRAVGDRPRLDAPPREGVPVWLARASSPSATGIACGLVNGVLISYGKLPPFIATLAMLSVGRGLSLVISQGSPIAFPDSVSHLGDTLGGWLPVPVLVMVVMGADRRVHPRPHLHRPLDVRDRRQRGGGPAVRPAGQAAEARHLRPVRALRRRRGHRARLPAVLRAAAGRGGLRAGRDRRGRHRRRQPRRRRRARRPAP